MMDLPRLVLARDRMQQGLTSKMLARQCNSGMLVRIRHGVYVDGAAWGELRPWEQYRLRVQAAAETFAAPTVFARHSAASVWGIPTIGHHHAVHALTFQNDGGRSRAGVRRRVEFADPLSASAGESYSRALICAAGFEAPALQHEIWDDRGLIGYSDYYWHSVRIVGEFDGVDKYLKPEYLKGRSASQAVVDEKYREDRIRATGCGVIRWVWDDLMAPGRLERKLAVAGIPRRRARSAG